MAYDNTSVPPLDVALYDLTLTPSTSLTGNVSADGQDANASTGAISGPDVGEEAGSNVILYIMLTCFIVVGSVGNALAIYVFASLKQKLTSTIFILTLAGTDFMTCVITIPFTIYMEYMNWHVGSDFVCKMYNFLSTTTVPFSAVVMVAIAVDRYMCICHPFHHWMTIQRARIIIGILLIYVSFFGIMICIHYSIHWPLDKTVNVTDDSAGSVHHYNNNNNLSYASFPTGSNNFTDYVNVDDMITNTSVSYQLSLISGEEAGGSSSSISSSSNSASGLLLRGAGGVIGSSSINMTSSNGGGPHILQQVTSNTKTIPNTVQTDECSVRWDYIDEQFMKVFRNMYFANFVLSCAIVLILYSLIYRYVISQRKKKLRIKSAQCCLLWNARSIENHHESVEITQDIELSNVNGDRYNARLMSNDEAAAAENHNNGSTRKCSISKARIERMRVANIKTAFTLFIVNVVFILSFLPAWLMVMGFLDMHVILFYMHFFYNVCNPLIYAFLNQNFKAELERILHCGKV